MYYHADLRFVLNKKWLTCTRSLALSEHADGTLNMFLFATMPVGNDCEYMKIIYVHYG